MGKFNVGDLVCGSRNSYGVTNRNMTLGLVVKSPRNGTVDIKVLEHNTHPNEVGGVFPRLDENHFDLVLGVKEVPDVAYTYKGAHFVKFISEYIAFRKGEIGVIKISEDNKPNVQVKKETGVTFIIIEDRYTICVPTQEDVIGISVRNLQDEPNEEIGKALAFYRTFKQEEDRKKKMVQSMRSTSRKW